MPRLLKLFDSQSSPGTIYEVVLNDDGGVSCNCPGWRFKRGPERTCRHVREVIEVGVPGLVTVEQQQLGVA